MIYCIGGIFTFSVLGFVSILHHITLFFRFFIFPFPWPLFWVYFFDFRHVRLSHSFGQVFHLITSVGCSSTNSSNFTASNPPSISARWVVYLSQKIVNMADNKKTAVETYRISFLPPFVKSSAYSRVPWVLRHHLVCTIQCVVHFARRIGGAFCGFLTHGQSVPADSDIRSTSLISCPYDQLCVFLTILICFVWGEVEKGL